MSGFLAVLETRRGEMRPTSLEAVAAGLELKRASGETLTVAIVDSGPERFGAAVALDDVDDVIAVRSPVEHFDATFARRALAAVIDEVGPAVVLLSHTLDAQSYAPGVAARHGYGLATDVAAIRWSDGLIVEREFHGGTLRGELEFTGDGPAIVLLRPGAVAPVAATGGRDGSVRELAVEPPQAVTAHVGYESRAADDIDISKAEFIVAIGRAIEDEDDVEEFEGLAAGLGATLCTSRPLVDAGLMPASRQVGQSGKSVAPKVYLAFGISGASQHLAGIQAAGTVIAVNRDANAPIFNAADFGVVADAFEIAEALKARGPL